MPLPKKIKFDVPPSLLEEAQRRAVVMFGEDWRTVCSACHDNSRDQAICVGDLKLSFSQNGMWAWENDELHDLPDGSPASVWGARLMVSCKKSDTSTMA